MNVRGGCIRGVYGVYVVLNFDLQYPHPLYFAYGVDDSVVDLLLEAGYRVDTNISLYDGSSRVSMFV